MTTDLTHYTSEAITLLSSLISIPSISREEDKAADFLQTYIEESGIMTGRSGNNIWCISPMFDIHKPTILLNSHIDTVKPVNGGRKQPFTAKMDNGKLYGLGSNDAGASVVSLFQAYRHLSATEQAYNLIFLASCEEEVSGKNGIESVLSQLPPIALGIVGEPTEIHPAIAEKGLMVLDVCAHGKAGHAARNEGENAIYKALDDIQWFRTYRFPKESSLLGPVKMSVTQVNAGTQHNVIPDLCSFVVDIRSNECYSNEELYQEICSQVQSTDEVPFGQDRSGQILTFAYRRRIHRDSGDRRSHSNIYRDTGWAGHLTSPFVLFLLVESNPVDFHLHRKVVHIDITYPFTAQLLVDHQVVRLVKRELCPLYKWVIISLYFENFRWNNLV